jgi:nitrite reductase (NADH) large subunit
VEFKSGGKRMKYVIIGNGIAGTTAAANIRDLDGSGEITVLTDEAAPFYSRIRLIEYIAREAGERDIIIHKDDWYKKRGIRLLLNTPVSGIDKDNRQIITEKGVMLEYDKCLNMINCLSQPAVFLLSRPYRVPTKKAFLP